MSLGAAALLESTGKPESLPVPPGEVGELPLPLSGDSFAVAEAAADLVVEDVSEFDGELAEAIGEIFGGDAELAEIAGE